MDGDPLPMLINIGITLLLVFLNGFFVAAEFAIVKIRASRIDALVQEGNVKARFARSITNNLNAYLSACQLGITLASLGLGWIAEPAIVDLIEPILLNMGASEAVVHTIAFLIGFSLITIFHIILGEQAPKTFAIRQSEAVTLWTAVPLIGFYYIMFPFIWFLNNTSNWLLRRFGIEPEEEQESAHTEEEIRILMKESHKNGFIDNTELTLFDNIFDFTETNAREIMIPRTEMVCLYTGLSFEENREITIKEMHTRYPVCDPDKDNIIGFVHIKDILKADKEVKDIREITRPILTVPESIQISSLLKMMQKKKTQMVLLIDEYGGTSGLVTIEDILEEIVGEIQDEFDEERPAIEKKDEDTYSIDGRLLIEEVNEYFNLDIRSEDYDTIGGWIYSQVEIPPKKNQKIGYQDYEFIVDETDHLRVSRLLVRKMSKNKELLDQVVS